MRTELRVIVGLALLGLAACGGGEEAGAGEAEGDTATVALAPPPPAQDADHEFLRAMADHHEAFVTMGGEMRTRAANDQLKSAAQKLSSRQEMERGVMTALIKQHYGEEYTPRLTPRAEAQADSLELLAAPGADVFIVRTIIAHHQDGIGLIDQFEPRMTKPDVRQLAEAMRTQQEREAQQLIWLLQQL